MLRFVVVFFFLNLPRFDDSNNVNRGRGIMVAEKKKNRHYTLVIVMIVCIFTANQRTTKAQPNYGAMPENERDLFDLCGLILMIVVITPPDSIVDLGD